MISLIYNVRIMQKHNLLQIIPRGIYITFWNVILSFSFSYHFYLNL